MTKQELTKEKIIEIWEDVADAFANKRNHTSAGFCYYLSNTHVELMIPRHIRPFGYRNIDKFFEASGIHPRDVGFEEWYLKEPSYTFISDRWPIFNEAEDPQAARAKFAIDITKKLKSQQKLTRGKIIELWEELAQIFNETPSISLYNFYGYCYYLQTKYNMTMSQVIEFFIVSGVTAKEIGKPLIYVAETYWKVFTFRDQFAIMALCASNDLHKNNFRKRSQYAKAKAQELKQKWGIE
jgi:hypothetical protein